MRISSPYSEKRLKNYALWYYERYLPSINRLREKLLEKSDKNSTLVEHVLFEIREIFIEEVLIDNRVRFLVDAHKNERFIRQSLRKKWFDMELVEKKLELYHDDLHAWEGHEAAVTKKYRELLTRWKSKKAITMALILKFPHFSAEIEHLITRDDDDLENLKKEYEKLRKKYPGETPTIRQKISANLLRKWFRYQDIKKLAEL